MSTDTSDAQQLISELQFYLRVGLPELASESGLSVDELQRVQSGGHANGTFEKLLIFAQRRQLYKILEQFNCPVWGFDQLRDFWANFNAGPASLLDLSIPTLTNEPTTFLGLPLDFPLGIPASCLTVDAEFTSAYARLGYDLITYKTVRSQSWQPHDFPHWAFVPDLTRQVWPNDQPEFVIATTEYLTRNNRRISTVNSVGVPSTDPEQWQPDIRRAKAALRRPGQILIVSVMGSPETARNYDELADQFREAAALAVEAGADIIEANLSCPNTVSAEGVPGDLICRNPELSAKMMAAIARDPVASRVPRLMKITHLEDDLLVKLLRACKDFVQGVSAINTIAVETRKSLDSKEPFFDRSEQQGIWTSRNRPGVSGWAIRDAGLDMARRLVRARDKELKCSPVDFAIIGIGGVMSPKDFDAYREIGVNAVQSCTGVWINPQLASEIRSAETDRSKTLSGRLTPGGARQKEEVIDIKERQTRLVSQQSSGVDTSTMERTRYIAADLPVAGIAITFATVEDALRARRLIPRGLAVRSLGRGLVADVEMLRAFAGAEIPIYRFVPPPKPLSNPLNVADVIARLERSA